MTPSQSSTADCRKRRALEYQGQSERSRSQRQSGNAISMIQTGLPMAAARWAAAVSSQQQHERAKDDARMPPPADCLCGAGPGHACGGGRRKIPAELSLVRATGLSACDRRHRYARHERVEPDVVLPLPHLKCRSRTRSSGIVEITPFRAPRRAHVRNLGR